jgi:hypothetical protein
MFRTENTSQGLATRQALYCVWIPANGTPGAPLVSVWMDSMMRAFECQVEEAKETSAASVGLGLAEEKSENSAFVDGQRY